MRVSLDEKRLKPNRLRDFKLDPVDDERVDDLAESIDEHKFWGGCVGRMTDDGPELIAGEHRRQAALKAGLTHADIFIGDYDDEQALRIYATENATQRGNTSTAVLGTIGSAIRILLRKQIFTGASTSENRGGHNRDGIGRPAIRDLLDGVPGITDNVIKQQLANLKMSGEYDRIVEEVIAEAEAAQAEAEAEAARQEAAARALAAAEEERRIAAAERARVAKERADKARADAEEAAKRKREANEEREREAAAKREAAARRRAEKEAARHREEERRKAEQEAAAAKAQEEAAAAKAQEEAVQTNKSRLTARREKAKKEKHVVAFDMQVTTVFKDPRHVETFRVLVTEDAKIAKLLPPDRQFALAKALVEQQRQEMENFIAKGGNKRHASQYELTSAYIENHLYDLAAAVSMIEHYKSEAEKREAAEELRKAGWLKRFENYEEQIAGHTRSLASATSKLAELMREAPQEHGVRSFKIRHAVLRLEQILGTLKGFGFHGQAVDGESYTIDLDAKLLEGEVLPPLQ